MKMDISETDNLMPDSNPPWPGLERRVWETLVPRLIGKTKLDIIKALLRVRRPLSATELRVLAGLENCTLEHVRYHVKYLEGRVGVLEVVDEEPRPDGQGVEPKYFFPQPPASSSSPSSTAAA